VLHRHTEPLACLRALVVIAEYARRTLASRTILNLYESPLLFAKRLRNGVSMLGHRWVILQCPRYLIFLGDDRLVERCHARQRTHGRTAHAPVTHLTESAGQGR
jgi:hypothetical protein